MAMSMTRRERHLRIVPLVTKVMERNAKIEAMARDLILENAIGDRCDAIRALHKFGYPAFDIHVLVEEAQAAAFQELVAKEMGEA
jgi:hypothetical protein